MKNLIFILMMLMTLSVQGQTRIDTLRASIKESLEEGNIISLCDNVYRMAFIASQSKDKKTFEEAGNYLFGTFDGLDINEKNYLRTRATNVANLMSKMDTRIDGPLTYFLLAHHYLDNKEEGDTLSWYIENRIANIYTRLGDFEKATHFQNIVRHSLENAIQLFPDSLKYKDNFSRLYADIGTNLKYQLKWDDAIAMYKAGYILAESLGSTLAISSNLLGLAEVELEKMNLTSAESYLGLVEKTLPELIQNPRYHERESMYYRLNGLLKLKSGNYRESIASFEKAVTALGKVYSNPKRREFGKLFEQFGEAYFMLDSFDQAQKFSYEGLSCLLPGSNSYETLPGIPQLYHENTFVELFDLLSRIYMSRFQLTGDSIYLRKTLHCIDLGLFSNDLIRDAVLADPSRLLSVAENKAFVHDGIEANHLMYTMNPHQSYLNDARRFFDRSKSLLLKDNTWKNQVRSIISPVDRGRLTEIDSSLLSLYQRNLNREIDDADFMAGFLALKEKEGEIYHRYKEVSLEKKAVNDYIEYAVFAQHIYALASLDEKIYFLKLGTYDALAGLIQRVENHILLKEYSLDYQILNELYEFLIAPFSNLPSHVVIIPDDVLSFLPFDILQNANGEYLIEQTTISYTNEYEQYNFAETYDTSSFRIVCMVPSYGKSYQKDIAAVRGNLYHLEYAKVEADSIISLYGEQGYTSVPSGKEDYRLNYTMATIFHFAGHAIVHNDEAFLALGDLDEPQYKVTATEISLIHHESDLVVLSACETGLGTVDKGEGVRSLGRSFMESGAKSAIISLWNVNDRATAEIMTVFHRNLKEGMRKDEALRKAKLNYINTTQDRTRYPFYWGAFIALGNMGPID